MNILMDDPLEAIEKIKATLEDKIKTEIWLNRIADKVRTRHTVHDKYPDANMWIRKWNADVKTLSSVDVHLSNIKLEDAIEDFVGWAHRVFGCTWDYTLKGSKDEPVHVFTPEWGYHCKIPYEKRERVEFHIKEGDFKTCEIVEEVVTKEVRKVKMICT